MLHSGSESGTDISYDVDRVVGRFGALVRRIGLRYRLCDTDIDELLQELRIRLWRASERGEQIAALPTSYVYRASISAALDLLRRRRTQAQELSVPLEESDHQSKHTDGPEQDIAEAELADTVAAAVETIPASRRPVVRMYLAGYPREEIAALLGWSEAKTRNLLYRGLDDLREKLKASGIGVENDG